jgi:hypothetical protein
MVNKENGYKEVFKNDAKIIDGEPDEFSTDFFTLQEFFVLS